MSDLLDRAGDILATVAPTIATALGGPLAGSAVTVVLKALGLSPDTSEAQAAAALQGATLDQIAALRKADQDFQIAMWGLDQKDRDSARQREVSVKDMTPMLLAYAVTAGFFGLIGLMAFHQLPEANQQMMNIMVGSLGTAWVSVIAYYYGANRQNSDAQTALANSVPASAVSSLK